MMMFSVNGIWCPVDESDGAHENDGCSAMSCAVAVPSAWPANLPGHHASSPSLPDSSKVLGTLPKDFTVRGILPKDCTFVRGILPKDCTFARGILPKDCTFVLGILPNDFGESARKSRSKGGPPMLSTMIQCYIGLSITIQLPHYETTEKKN